MVSTPKTSKVAFVGGDPAYLRRFRLPTLRELRRRGFEVLCITAGEDAILMEELEAIGARWETYQLDRGSIDARTEGPTFLRLLSILAAERPDYLITHTPKLITYGSLLSRLCGIPRHGAIFSGLGSAFTENGTRKRELIRAAVVAALKVGLKRTEAIIFLNPDDLRDLCSFGVVPEHTRKVLVKGGAGVSLTEYPAKAIPEKPRFLLVGRMIKEKGVGEFMATATALRAQGYDAEFELLGPIDETHPEAIAPEELHRWGEQEGCAYLGRTDDVRPYLERCSVFVLPSYREGLPRSGLEAMATGRAVVCSDAPGCRQLIGSEGNGVLVQPRDAKALELALRDLIEDPERVQAMGKASRLRCEAHFSDEVAVVDTLEGLGLLAP